MKELIFRLSEFELVKLVPDYDMDCEQVAHCCDHVKVYFVSGHKELELVYSSSGDALEQLSSRLAKVIDNKLQLHESIVKNLGFMENEYDYEYPAHIHNSMFYQIPYKQSEGTYWIGQDYKVWSVTGYADPFTATWLYNDVEGNIIFEITPLYRWSFREDEPEDPDFVTYEEFMKSYKPIIRRIIPRTIAQVWLKRAIRWYKIFYKNEQISNETRNSRDVFYFKPKLDNKYDNDKDVFRNIWYWDEKKEEWNIKTKYGYMHVGANGILQHQGIHAQADILKFTKIFKI